VDRRGCWRLPPSRLNAANPRFEKFLRAATDHPGPAFHP
jgi:hypothetical protein